MSRTNPAAWMTASTLRLIGLPRINDFRAVERGDGQQIEHRQVDADIRRDLQKRLQTARSDFAGKANRRDRPAEGGKPQAAREQLPQHFKNGAADLEGINEGAPDRFKELEPLVRRRGDHPGIALPVLRELLLYADAPPEGVGIRQVFLRDTVNCTLSPSCRPSSADIKSVVR